MKNIFKIAGIAMCFIHTAKAQEVPEVQNPNVITTPSYFVKFNSQKNAFKMRVLLSKREGDHSVLHLRIRDEYGNWLYSKYLNKKESQASVAVNFEDLPDGTYTFEVRNKYGKTSKTYVKETEKYYLKYTKQLVALN